MADISIIGNEVKDYINGNIEVYAPLTLDLLDENTNSICIQQLPSEPKATKYLYGASEGNFNFRLLTKHEDKISAIEQLTAISNHFNTTHDIVLDDRTTIKVETTASPTLLEYSQKEYFVYQAQFKLIYKQKGIF